MAIKSLIQPFVEYMDDLGLTKISDDRLNNHASL